MKDRIQAIMESHNLSQQSFSMRLGLSAATISSIFTGRTNPTNNHVQAIHRAFPEININWLLFGEGEMLQSATSEGSKTDGSIIGQKHGSSPELQIPSSSEIGAKGTSSDDEATASLFSSVSSAGRTASPPPVGSVLSPELQLAMLAQLKNTKPIDKPMRRIKEIRVFYDDGTFEAFAPSAK